MPLARGEHNVNYRLKDIQLNYDIIAIGDKAPWL